MKKTLLTGAAVAAMLIGAGVAQAQTSPIEVRIGGDAFFEAGLVSQKNDAGLNNGDFRDRYRLNIVVTGKASSTLSYGARMRLRANNATPGNGIDADRGYLFIDSAYGNVRLGTHTSYNDDIGGVTRPIDYLFLGETDNIASWAGDSALMAHTLTDNGLGTKIMYITPEFAGFSAGLSYTPDSGSVLNNVSRADIVSASRYENAWEAGLNYANKFSSGLSVAANIAYMGADAKPTSALASGQYESLRAWQGGLSLGYAGFTVAGGYIVKDGDNSGPMLKSATNKSDTRIANVGASYAIDKAVIGVGYIWGEREGNTATTGNLEQQVWSVGANYILAPGLSVGGEYANVHISGDTTAVTNDRANVFLLRTFAAF